MAKTDYIGIDYGMGKTNIDDKGIRYGVIPQGEVLQAWCDESEPVYGEIECEECHTTFNISDNYGECPNCQWDSANVEIEPNHFEYLQDGYKIFQNQDDPDLFVEKSPYYTYAQFCSPCAPGACYLMNFFDFSEDLKAKGMTSKKYPETLKEHAKSKGFPKCYCLGHDWFETGRAPYTVYDVKTDKVVNPD